MNKPPDSGDIDLNNSLRTVVLATVENSTGRTENESGTFQDSLFPNNKIGKLPPPHKTAYFSLARNTYHYYPEDAAALFFPRVFEPFG